MTELPPLEPSVLDALDTLFGSLPRAETSPVLVQAARTQPVVRVAFTDAPVTLGTHGRRKKVSAGVGLLFPDMMTP